MSLIYWDSMLFIYQFDDHPVFGPRVDRILERMEERADTLCTSTFAAAEVMAGPSRKSDWVNLSRYRDIFRSPDLRLLDFRLTTAEIFAEIRGRLGVSAADAVHLACASEARVDVFLTHDKRLAGRLVPGIQLVTDIAEDVFV
jgi:predicted nucleic acid-binding protein